MDETCRTTYFLHHKLLSFLVQFTVISDLLPVSIFDHQLERKCKKNLSGEHGHPDSDIPKLEFESKKIAEGHVEDPVGNEIEVKNFALQG